MAIEFVQGNDNKLERILTNRMSSLAENMDFEAAELLRRHLEKLRKARSETKDSFHSVGSFNAVVLLAADSVSRCKIAYARNGAIVGFEEYSVEDLGNSLPPHVDAYFNKPLEIESREWQYDEFCLVSNFVVDPLQSVDVILVQPDTDVTASIIERIQQKKRKRKQPHVDTVA